MYKTAQKRTETILVRFTRIVVIYVPVLLGLTLRHPNNKQSERRQEIQQVTLPIKLQRPRLMTPYIYYRDKSDEFYEKKLQIR